jgi:hypothetical protein
MTYEEYDHKKAENKNLLKELQTLCASGQVLFINAKDIPSAS